MTDVSWIKLKLNMFDDERIKLIESMPEADSILIIWIRLLSQAGKTNANGYIFLNENVPYTVEMLSTLFNRPLNTVRLALTTLAQFEMIEVANNGFIRISNWNKHQNIDGLDKIREQNRLKMQKYRASKKFLSSNCNVTGNVTGNVTVTDCNQTEGEVDIDKESEVVVVGIGKEPPPPPTQNEQPEEKQSRIIDKTDIKTNNLIDEKEIAAQNERVNLPDDIQEWIKLRYRHWFNRPDIHPIADVGAIHKEIIKTYTQDIKQDEVLKIIDRAFERVVQEKAKKDWVTKEVMIRVKWGLEDYFKAKNLAEAKAKKEAIENLKPGDPSLWNPKQFSIVEDVFGKKEIENDYKNSEEYRRKKNLFNQALSNGK